MAKIDCSTCACQSTFNGGCGKLTTDKAEECRDKGFSDHEVKEGE